MCGPVKVVNNYGYCARGGLDLSLLGTTVCVWGERRGGERGGGLAKIVLFFPTPVEFFAGDFMLSWAISVLKNINAAFLTQAYTKLWMV